MKKDALKARFIAASLIAAVFISVAIISTVSVTGNDTVSVAAKPARGDVNNDGSINLSDVTALLSGISSDSSDMNAAISDLNTDGYITLADALTLLKRITSGYIRSDLSGSAVSASVSVGISADMSCYTSVNGVALTVGGIYASDETGKRIFKLSKSGETEKIYSANECINAVIANGDEVYSLEGGINGRIVKLSSDLAQISMLDVGHTPSDMAITGSKGYITNRFSNTVSVINLATMSLVKTVQVEGREPIAAVAAGSDVYIACHLPNEAMTENTVSADIVVISGTDDSISKVIPLVNGASGVKDICVSPDKKTVYASHIVGRYAYPTTQLDRGWINTNCFSIIDTASKEVVCTCLLDEVDEGAANPWGITLSQDGKYLCVALSGLDEVMVIDTAKLYLSINKVKSGRHPSVDNLSDIVNYLPFLDGCRERISVGKGVRAISEKDGILYCGTYFDGTVDKIELATKSVSRIQFTTQPSANEVRKGQILWSDANNCYQRWQSCNSCHPDAAIDGFNWDNLNDGLGNGKSAKSMLYSHRTPPVMITGIRTSAEIAVAAGMKFIQFNTLSQKELAYIDEYLKSLSPIPSPALSRDGILTESAKSGEELFNANCATCHPAPLYTDLKEHNVDTAKLAREDGYFDTPSLIEVWRTAPYLHDGSLNTVEEAVEHFASKLSSAEVKALSDYVRSIGDEGEYYGAEQIKSTANGSEIYNTYIDGMQVNSISVRYQNEHSAKNVVAAFSVYDKNGSQVYYCDAPLPRMQVKSAAVITFGNRVILPVGGYYTVVFIDEDSGTQLSSPLKIN